MYDKRLLLLTDREKTYYSGHELTQWVLIKLELMRSLGKGEISCGKVEEQYWHLPEIRKAKVRGCFENGNISEAIRILDESRRLDIDKPGLIIDYSRQIRELYRELGDMKNCRKEARHILQSSHHDFLEDFRIWKALCVSEEWETERETVFDGMKDRSLLRELYCEEELYDRLMGSLMESMTWELPKYEKVLKPLYPGELLAWYEQDVCQRAKHPGTREHYRHLADILLHMRKYPDGNRACQYDRQ